MASWTVLSERRPASEPESEVASGWLGGLLVFVGGWPVPDVWGGVVVAGVAIVLAAIISLAFGTTGGIEAEVGVVDQDGSPPSSARSPPAASASH